MVMPGMRARSLSMGSSTLQSKRCKQDPNRTNAMSDETTSRNSTPSHSKEMSRPRMVDSGMKNRVP